MDGEKTPENSTDSKTVQAQKKKKGVVLYSIKMAILLYVAFALCIELPRFFQGIAESSRYGSQAIKETLSLITVVILMILEKKAHIFTERKVSLKKGLKTAWPVLIIAGVFFLVSIFTIAKEGVQIGAIINIAILTLAVGLFEEILFRGWLYNTIKDHYNDRKNPKITALIISSILFGLIHVANAAGTQTLLDSSLQALNAIGLGLIFGAIYIITENIWVVAIVHAIWDYATFLGDSPYLTNTIYGEATSSVVIQLTIFTALLVVALVPISAYYLSIINGKKIIGEKFTKVLPIIGIVIYSATYLCMSLPSNDYEIKPKFETRNLGDTFVTKRYGKNTFNLSYEKTLQTNCANSDNTPDETAIQEETDNITNCIPTQPAIETTNLEFKLSEEGIPTIKNTSLEEEIQLSEESFTDAALVENEDNYFIYFANLSSNSIYYVSMNKSEIENTREYLESIKANIKEYYVPTIQMTGSIEVEEKNYAFIISDYNGYFFIGEDNKVYVDR